MAVFGQSAVLLSLLLSLYACTAAMVGQRCTSVPLFVSARRAQTAGAVLLTAAVGTLVFLLLDDDFSIQYVAEVSSRALPPLFKVTALWGGQAGSLLLWACLLSLACVVAVSGLWHQLPRFVPYALILTQATLAFFVSLSSGSWAALATPLLALGQAQAATLFAGMATLDPFHSLGFLPADGSGLNPLLLHTGMVLHPPFLYVGMVGIVPPFALVTAGLVKGEAVESWLGTARRWVLVAWSFLSIGLMLGMWWAYDVLGWGGYWSWDAVENAALMPWLTATAFLHAAAVTLRRGTMRVWSTVLIPATYLLTVFGVFITRSGMVESVHAFATSGIGPLLLAFFAASSAFIAYLLLARRGPEPAVAQPGSTSPHERFVTAGNTLLVLVALVTLWGTLVPTVSELFIGRKVVLGTTFFDLANGPLLGLLLTVMVLAPLARRRPARDGSWAKDLAVPAVVGVATGIGLYAGGVRELAPLPGTHLAFLPVALLLGVTLSCTTLVTQQIIQRVYAHSRRAGLTGAATPVRDWRRYGGLVVHLGLCLMALGVIGTRFLQLERHANLTAGQSLEVGSPLVGAFLLTFQGTEQSGAGTAVENTVALLGVRSGARFVGDLRPRIDNHATQSQPVTIPAIHSSPMGDLYVTLNGWDRAADSASISAYVEPLVNWLWIGCLVFVLGAVLVAWPRNGWKGASGRCEMSALAAGGPGGNDR